MKFLRKKVILVLGLVFVETEYVSGMESFNKKTITTFITCEDLVLPESEIPLDKIEINNTYNQINFIFYSGKEIYQVVDEIYKPYHFKKEEKPNDNFPDNYKAFLQNYKENLKKIFFNREFLSSEHKKFTIDKLLKEFYNIFHSRLNMFSKVNITLEKRNQKNGVGTTIAVKETIYTW